MRPIVHRLRTEYKGRVDVTSVRARSPRGQELARQYGTFQTPSFVFVRADGQMQNIFLGDMDEVELRDELDRLLAAP
jgi:hypothetical protein